MHDRNLLFSKYDLSGTFDNMNGQISAEISNYRSDYLLSVKLEDVCDHLVDKHTLEPPQIFTDQTELIEQGETKVPREDFGRRINVNGNYYVFAIPFTGDGNLFNFKASTFTYSPPCGEVRGGELHLKFVRTDHNGEALKQSLDSQVKTISDHLGWIKNDINGFNRNLRANILRQLEARKEKLIKDEGLVSSLGIPIRQRKGAGAAIPTPVSRKKIHIPQPKAPKKPFKPEPELEEKVYEQIIETMQNMVLVMERSPHAFAKMGEEDLRTHFLVQLNGLYEGQATGETFNFEGKTDILIRSEGKNVFIAECKFWKGAKALQETIDQLLGYLSWRDTKVALLIFNRNKEFGNVLAQIPDAVKDHPNYKKSFEQLSETDFRFILKSKLDENRELKATLLAFDVPK
jgi:hypothetical protein